LTCSSHLVDDLYQARQDLLACDLALARPPWAVIEVPAHLADVDRYYLCEARMIRDEPGHMFVYFDEEAWKRANADAIDRDARAVKLAMAAAHEEVMRWVGALTPPL
jgi:hypothetical protein